MHKTNETLTGEANVVRVKLPNFWSNNPTTWFIQAEAQFQLARISVDSSKYYHVVASLPQDVAESVSDLLQDPPTTDMYKKLKTTLIDRHSLSIEARIRKLISGEEIGDKKPSDYFRTLQRVAGNSTTVGTDLLKKLWLGRLPNVISIALVPHKDDELDKVLKVSDQIWEAMQNSNVSAIQNHSNLQRQVIASVSSDEISQLRNEINELKKIITNRDSSVDRSRRRFRGRGRSDSRHRSKSNRRYIPDGPMCYYHFKFRERANKCDKPNCPFKSSFKSNANVSESSQKN